MAMLSFGNRHRTVASANKSALAEDLTTETESNRDEQLRGSSVLEGAFEAVSRSSASLRSEDSDDVEARWLDWFSTAIYRVESRKYEIIKRAVDLALLVLLFPLICISAAGIAALVAITSKGSVLYTQERIGRYGIPFRIFKFRTMKANAEQVLAEHLLVDAAARREWFQTHKLREDPRITVCGRFLRRTSLDELPQLLNVLRGEMSLVGPRPIVWAERVKYGERFCFYTAAVPGVTGLWQVSGRCDVAYATRVALDEYYVRHWSLRRDFAILLKTPWAVCRRRGAY